MNQTEILYQSLQKVVWELNDRLALDITLNQQDIIKKNISLSGCNGRLWVYPVAGAYDVSLSGLSLESELSPRLKEYFGCEPQGYKQANANKGFKKQPYWRTTNLNDVAIICEMYAKTIK